MLRGLTVIQPRDTSLAGDDGELRWTANSVITETIGEPAIIATEQAL